ncbi:hypothetical protein PIB30_017906 [Stylosanthes scabra]|uniref:Uncharacterized protein n=1 Tax=Stylosanthes scabra TaxID=79078 RepID=A0ABU6Q977_9FABA|nr:hypothetical protein [Stylosanthes scabra]
MARSPPPGGAAARSEIAKLLISGAIAHPHFLNATKLHGALAPSSWRARTSARWPWCVRALALGALGLAPGRAARPRSLLQRAFGLAFQGAPARQAWRARAARPGT